MPVVQMVLLGFIVFATITLFYFVPVGMWIQGIVSLGIGRIRIVDLIRMRLRKISPRLVTDGVINLHKAGLQHITTDMLETHYLAGGNVQNIVAALIAADKATYNSLLKLLPQLTLLDAMSMKQFKRLSILKSSMLLKMVTWQQLQKMVSN